MMMTTYLRKASERSERAKTNEWA